MSGLIGAGWPGLVANTRRLAAIMFTDVVGFTAATRADEAGTLSKLRELEALIRPPLPRHGGREVKSTGDGLLVEFGSALDALTAAVEVQRLVREKDQTRPGTSLEIRIGIHVGDVEERDGDVFGDAVNVASRIVGAADPGGICLSQQVFDQVRHKTTSTLEKLPPRPLKGVDEPVDLYRVVLPWSTTAAPRSPSGPPRLAVLPLSNISPDPKDEYFADGLTEELIAVLSKIRGLRVIARTSVSQYKSTSKSIAQIGGELAVDTILEGSVRKAGNRIRITLQLIEVPTQEHVWANSYNRELDDVFTIQAEIAEETARALRLQLLRADAGSSPLPALTRDLYAYELYLKGVHAASLNTAEGFEEAWRFFEEAVRRDPNFAAAYSHWANSYALALGEHVSLREGYPKAKSLVEKALRLDPLSSEAHFASGNVAMQCEHDWEKAESEFRRAIELNPSDPSALEWFGILRFVQQRFDEARQFLDAAQALAPNDKGPSYWLMLVHVVRREFEPALVIARRNVLTPPLGDMDHARLGLVLWASGAHAEAREQADRVRSPAGTQAHYYAAALRALTGSPEDARALLGREGSTAYLSLTRRAGLHAVLGEREDALRLLEEDVAHGDRTLWFEYQFPTLASLRSEPRFLALLERLRLPTQTPPK